MSLQCRNAYADYIRVYRFLVVSGVALDLRKPKGPLMFEGKRDGLSFSIDRLVRENLQLIPSSKWLGMKRERHLEMIARRRGLVRRMLSMSM